MVHQRLLARLAHKATQEKWCRCNEGCVRRSCCNVDLVTDRKDRTIQKQNDIL